MNLNSVANCASLVQQVAQLIREFSVSVDLNRLVHRGEGNALIHAVEQASLVPSSQPDRRGSQDQLLTLFSQSSIKLGCSQWDKRTRIIVPIKPISSSHPCTVAFRLTHATGLLSRLSNSQSYRFNHANVLISQVLDWCAAAPSMFGHSS